MLYSDLYFSCHDFLSCSAGAFSIRELSHFVYTVLHKYERLGLSKASSSFLNLQPNKYWMRQIARLESRHGET